MKILALDAGGTSIKSACFADGQMEGFLETPSEAKSGAEFLLKNLHAAIGQYANYDVIAVSTTGQVDSVKGSILYANENVPGYTGTKLKALLEEKYHKPVFVENDVNAAAIGEGCYGAAQNENNFLCFTYGTGVGGAIVLNQEIFRGSSGVAGEFGHIITHADGLPCACGQKGCYEQYASTAALIRKAMEADKSLINGRLLFQSLESNTAAKKAIDDWIQEILYGLATLIHIFNPSAVVLGGGIMNESLLLDEICRQLPERIMASYRNVRVKRAQLGNHAGLYGMLAIATRACQK